MIIGKDMGDFARNLEAIRSHVHTVNDLVSEVLVGCLDGERETRIVHLARELSEAHAKAMQALCYLSGDRFRASQFDEGGGPDG